MTKNWFETQMNQSPYRLVEKFGNSKFDPNQIWDLLGTDLQDYLQDITGDDDILGEAYIPERYTALERDLNQFDPGQYTDNMVATYGAKGWTPDEVLHPEAEGLKDVVTDKAELHLLNSLLKRVDQIAMAVLPTATGALPPELPERRLLFVQAGIGAGKTTLLHHFARISAPQLTKALLIPYRFHVSIVNCDPDAVNDPIEDLWAKILRNVRQNIHQTAMLDDHDGWAKIAQEDIYESDRRFKPAVSRAPDGVQTAVKRIIYEVNDNDELFIQRCARTLWNSWPREIVVLVIDNIDRHEIPWSRQLALCSRLLALLGSCRYLIGIIPLREYTLGNIEQIKAARRYYHLDRMHMTTPVIGKVLQKRLEIVAKNLGRASAQMPIKVLPNITVTPADFMDLVRWVARSVDDEDVIGRKRQPTLEEYKRLRFSVSNFLKAVNDFDLRATLMMVLPAFKSWSFAVQNAVFAYFFNKRNRSSIQAARLGLDEMLRLICAGEWARYDQGNGSGIINIFGMLTEKPMPEVGMFPNLIMYRLLEYYDKFSSGTGSRMIKINDLRRDLGIFGYSAKKVDNLIMDTIYNRFVESPEGMRKDNIKNIIKTQKTIYYLHPLCKLLVYLENVRNDSPIQYESTPHEVRTKITKDLLEVLKFIDYIFFMEKAELDFIRNKDRDNRSKPNMRVYNLFLGNQPICWRLLRSVGQRASDLYRIHKEWFPEDESKTVLRRFHSLRYRIQEANRLGDLVPAIPAAKRRLYLNITPR